MEGRRTFLRRRALRSSDHMQREMEECDMLGAWVCVQREITEEITLVWWKFLGRFERLNEGTCDRVKSTL